MSNKEHTPHTGEPLDLSAALTSLLGADLAPHSIDGDPDCDACCALRSAAVAVFHWCTQQAKAAAETWEASQELEERLATAVAEKKQREADTVLDPNADVDAFIARLEEEIEDLDIADESATAASADCESCQNSSRRVHILTELIRQKNAERESRAIARTSPRSCSTGGCDVDTH